MSETMTPRGRAREYAKVLASEPFHAPKLATEIMAVEFLALEAELAAKDTEIEQLRKNVQHWMEESFVWNKRSQEERTQLAEAREILERATHPHVDKFCGERSRAYLAKYPESEKP